MNIIEQIRAFTQDVVVEANDFVITATYNGDNVEGWVQFIAKIGEGTGVSVAAPNCRQAVIITAEMQAKAKNSFCQIITCLEYGDVIDKLHQENAELTLDELAAVSAVSSRMSMPDVELPAFTEEAAAVVINASRSKEANETVEQADIDKFVKTYALCVKFFRVTDELSALGRKLNDHADKRMFIGTEVIDSIGHSLIGSRIAQQYNSKQHELEMTRLTLKH